VCDLFFSFPVSVCVDRRRLEFEPPEGGGGSVFSQCYNDSVHGLPPSNIRQSGDMGNIESNDGVATFDMCVCAAWRGCVCHVDDGVVGN
jgi:hypothetical protein